MQTLKPQNCCRPQLPDYENCVRDPNQPHARTFMPSTNPLHLHAMNNPTILGSVDWISNEIHFPMICPNPAYDCNMNEVKKDMHHPLYSKFHRRKILQEKYPVLYNIPPVDYGTYVAKMQQGMNCGQQRSQAQANYNASRDAQKQQFQTEFGQTSSCKTRRKREKCCPQCKKLKALRHMPHCCSCTCQWHQMIDDIPKCSVKCENVCAKACKKPPKLPSCKKSQKCQTITFSLENCYTMNEPPTPKQCRQEPVERPRGPISEYRHAYNHMPPNCVGPKFYQEPDPMLLRPKWNKSTRPQKNCCVKDNGGETIASNEAKLAALDKLLKQCKCERSRQTRECATAQHPAVPQCQQSDNEQ